MERIQLIQHKGVEILYLDFSELKPGEELDAVMAEVKARIQSQPEGSVALLTNVTGTRFDKEFIGKAQELSTLNKPYVRASAMFGVGGLLPIALTAVSRFSGRRLETFATKEEALDWLADQ